MAFSIGRLSIIKFSFILIICFDFLFYFFILQIIMSDILIKEITKDQIKSIPLVKSGMQVRVHERVKEKNKERIQVFEGIVLYVKHGKGINATFTVRKVVDGIGVEKTWPLHSPMIQKIEILKTPRMRKAKLYFLRDLSPTKIRRKLSVFKSIVPEKIEANELEEVELTKIAETEKEEKEQIVEELENKNNSEEK